MSPPPPRCREAGYNLVVLIVAITILNILLAASLPLWSTAIRREKEEELIFRGLQYAEALRVFQIRSQGALPTRLEQLIEAKPRCIRQLWKDPMTEDGKWGLIFQGQQNQQPIPGQPGGSGLKPQPGKEEEGEGEDPDGREPTFGPRKGEEVAAGPIVGVYSKSKEESILTFFGKERYNEWRFTVDILIQGQAQRGGPITGVPPQGPVGGIVLSTRWLGRPLPYLDQYSQLPGGGNHPGLNPPPQGPGGAVGRRPRAGGSDPSNKP